MDQPILRRLRELLIRASDLSFYRQRFLRAGLTPELLRGDDFAAMQTAFEHLLPLTPSEIRQHPGELLTSLEDITYRGVTSGTTDQAYIYFRDQTWNHQRLQALEVALAAWQITATDPIINVCSRLYPLRRHDISLVGLPDGQLRGWLRALAADAPIVLRGFPSRLCELLIQEDWVDLQIKAVICTGEPLFEHQIALIQKTLGCRIINEYGSQECGLQLWSCPLCNQFHLDSSRCWIEVVNQALVVTDLYSDLMPLIRYRNGDRAAWAPSTCPRGGMVLIPQGRQGELLSAEQNLPALPGVAYYRIVGEAAAGLQLLYLPQPPVADLPMQLPGYPPRLVQQWLPALNGVVFWNQIQPLPLEPSAPVRFPDTGHSLAWARYIEACLDSDRWIFYRLPRFMQLAQRHLAERQDFLEGADASIIDRCLLRLFCHAPPPAPDLQRWLGNIQERSAQSQDALRIEAVALQMLWLGELPTNLVAIAPIDRVAYRSLIALLENVIAQARLQQPQLPILQLSPLLPLFLTDLTHYFPASVAVLAHWATILGRGCYDLPKLPSQLQQRQIWLETQAPAELPTGSEVEDLVEACLQAALSHRQEQLIRLWTQLQQRTLATLPAPIAACHQAAFAKAVAVAYLEQGDRSRSYDALLSTIISLPQQEGFERHSKISNGKQRLW